MFSMHFSASLFQSLGYPFCIQNGAQNRQPILGPTCFMSFRLPISSLGTILVLLALYLGWIFCPDCNKHCLPLQSGWLPQRSLHYCEPGFSVQRGMEKAPCVFKTSEQSYAQTIERPSDRSIERSTESWSDRATE